MISPMRLARSGGTLGAVDDGVGDASSATPLRRTKTSSHHESDEHGQRTSACGLFHGRCLHVRIVRRRWVRRVAIMFKCLPRVRIVRCHAGPGMTAQLSPHRVDRS